MFFVPYVQCLVLFLHFPINSNFKFSQKATPELLQKLKLRKLPTFYTFRRRKKVLQKRKKIIYKMLEIFLNFSVDFKFSTSPEINTSPYCRQKFLFLKKISKLNSFKMKIQHAFIYFCSKKIKNLPFYDYSENLNCSRCFYSNIATSREWKGLFLKQDESPQV